MQIWILHVVQNRREKELVSKGEERTSKRDIYAFGFCKGFKFQPRSPINDLIPKMLYFGDVNAKTIVVESPTNSKSSISMILRKRQYSEGVFDVFLY